MNPEDRASVLAQIGVIEVPDAPSVENTPEKTLKAPRNGCKSVTKDEKKEEKASDVLARILSNAGASKDAALAMCDTEAQTFFDARKIDKIEAAKRGLDDRSVHNKPLWQEAQTLRNTLKTGVRQHFQERTIATKIKTTSDKAEVKRGENDDAALESFIKSEAFKALFAEHRKSLTAQEGTA